MTTVGSWVVNAGVRGEEDDVGCGSRARRASLGWRRGARSAFERDGASGWMVERSRGYAKSIVSRRLFCNCT